MAFEDQVRLVNQHTDIFTSAGSAAYNILFAQNQPTVHFLTSGIPRQDYFLMPAVAGASAAYINCFGLGNRPLIKKSTPLDVEMPKILDYLDGRGFLKKRLRASLMGRSHGMQDTFDELWLFEIVRDEFSSKTLTPEIEEEALSRSRSSWPISWALARHYASENDPRFETMVRQFIDLTAAETDINRLASFQEAVKFMAKRILKSRKQLNPETDASLVQVLTDRLLIEAPEKGKGGREKSNRVLATADPLKDPVGTSH